MNVDTNAQDIFESSDIEEDITPEINELEYNEEINIEESRLNFAKINIANNTFDFLGSIINLKGYYLEEINETNEDKLIRIEKELEELKQEEPKAVQLITLLNQLRHKSDTPIVELEKDHLNLIPHVEPSKRNLKSLIELDDKLNKLESLVGDESESIQLQINDLNRKISIIDNPEFSFNVIKDEIKSMTTSMEKLQINKKIFNITDDEIKNNDDRKIDEIYKNISLLESSKKIPLLTSRLKSLNQTYNDMESNINLSNHIDELISNLKNDLTKWDDSIINLNKN